MFGTTSPRLLRVSFMKHRRLFNTNILSPVGKIPKSVLLFYLLIIATPLVMTAINIFIEIWLQKTY